MYFWRNLNIWGQFCYILGKRCSSLHRSKKGVGSLVSQVGFTFSNPENFIESFLILHFFIWYYAPIRNCTLQRHLTCLLFQTRRTSLSRFSFYISSFGIMPHFGIARFKYMLAYFFKPGELHLSRFSFLYFFIWYYAPIRYCTLQRDLTCTFVHTLV